MKGGTMRQAHRHDGPTAATGAGAELALTGEQRAAVTHGAGALLVFAGPGSGKTRTLTARIAHLLATRRASGREILALTFTVRAAEEMRVRLVGLVGHDAAASVTVATFHALCARILRSHAGVFGRSPSFSIYEQADVVRITRDVLADEHDAVDDVAERAAQIAARIGLAQSRLRSPTLLRAGDEPDREQIAAVWEHVDAELERCNAFDFPGLVTHAVGLLREHEAVRERYRRRWRHILVDEFQDTDVAQLALLAALAGPRGCAPDGSLLVFGDDDQSIFGWRGADVENLLGFERLFPCAQRLVLRRNFRCRPAIVQAASRCIAANARREPKALIAERAAGGELRLVRFGNDHAEAAWVTKRIAASIAAGSDPREILVLSRSLRWTGVLQQALTGAGIAHRVIGARSLWERVEVQDALAHVALVANPHDARAFRRAVGTPTDREQFRRAGVAAPTRGCGAAGQRAVIAFARDSAIDLIEACVRVQQTAVRGAATKAALELFGGELSAVREALNGGGAVARAVVAAITFSDGPVAAYQALLDQAADVAVLRDTTRVLEDLRSLCRAAHSYEREHGAAATLAGFLDVTRCDQVDALTAEQDDRLTISTIHAAKGTEAREVYVLGCEERRLPSSHAIDDEDPLAVDEERRLFYVALTRAKDRLVLSASGERLGSPTAGASRFLAEAGL
jgi:DNA helicase-2/ATP-dependent DNA helicase PcrA